MANPLRPSSHGRASTLLLSLMLLGLWHGGAGASDTASDEQAAHTLSVAPLDQPVYPADRPSWIDDPPQLGGEGDEVWPVHSLLRPTAEEARESLQVQMQGAAAAYAEQFLGARRAGRLGESALRHWELDEIASEDRYSGTVKVGEQTMYEEAVRLRFDEPYRQHLAAAWQEREVGRRLSFMGITGGAGLCVLLAGTGFIRRMSRPVRGTA